MIILLLALVVLGPEKLPEAMRKLGKMYGELKRMSTGFQEEFRSAVDEPLREFRKAVDEPMNEIRSTANALRDSADFRRFEAGERSEKPKSGDMAAITEPAALLSPADPDAVPVAETPNFQPDDGSDPDPGPPTDAGSPAEVPMEVPMEVSAQTQPPTSQAAQPAQPSFTEPVGTEPESEPDIAPAFVNEDLSHDDVSHEDMNDDVSHEMNEHDGEGHRKSGENE